jgi:hypothetical protein
MWSLSSVEEASCDDRAVRLLDVRGLVRAVDHLAAHRGQLTEVAVEAHQDLLDVGRHVVEGGLLLRIRNLGGVHRGMLAAVQLDGFLLLLGVPVGLGDHHAVRALVLQVVDQSTGRLGQHREGAGPLGVARLLDVVDQAAHADDDRRQRGHQHDQAELGPDREIPQPSGRPAQTRHDAVRRHGALAHVTVLLFRTRSSARPDPAHGRHGGRAPEIPSRRVSKRKSSRTRTGCVMRCCSLRS